MPKPPEVNPATRQLRPSVFATLAAQFKTLPQPPVPLHLGDTFRLPPRAAQWPQVMERLPANPYVYANPAGLEELREAVAQRLAAKGLPGIQAADVIPTSGGTGALALLVHTWCAPGDEVLILSPYWPLIRGMVDTVGATPVEVPFYARLRAGESVAQILGPHVRANTAALYVTSPNNPCGTVLSRKECQQIADFAIAHNLRVIADEAYHDFVFAEGGHTFLASLPGMAQRTATVLTASKSFALAGTRVGFLIGDASWLNAAKLISTHLIYQIPIVCQLAALGALQDSAAWIAETRALYREAAELVQHTVQARFTPSQGGAYVLLDLTEELRGRPCIEWIGELLREGVCVSPGSAFGEDFEPFARLCYTAVALDQLAVGIERLNRSLERIRAGRPLAA